MNVTAHYHSQHDADLTAEVLAEAFTASHSRIGPSFSLRPLRISHPLCRPRPSSSLRNLRHLWISHPLCRPHRIDSKDAIG